jgi:hypothetical protein
MAIIVTGTNSNATQDIVSCFNGFNFQPFSCIINANGNKIVALRCLAEAVAFRMEKSSQINKLFCHTASFIFSPVFLRTAFLRSPTWASASHSTGFKLCRRHISQTSWRPQYLFIRSLVSLLGSVCSSRKDGNILCVVQ